MPSFTLKGQDGASYTVDAPDENAAMGAFTAMNSQAAPAAAAPAAAAPAPAPSEPAQAQAARDVAATRTRSSISRPHFDAGNTTMADVKAGVTQGAKGFNEGIAPIIQAIGHAPLDLVNALLNPTPAGEGSENVKPTDIYKDTFVNGAPPSTPSQEALRAGGKMAGENMPLLAGGMGLATSGVRAGVPLIEQAGGGVLNKVRGAADAVLEWMAQHPTAAARSDTIGAALSGAGGETGRSIAEEKGAGPTGQKLAEMIGQFGTPAAAFTYSKWAPTRLAAGAATYAGKKAFSMVPEEVLPSFAKPEGGSVTERMAERLAYANREGKYANPTEPPPAEPNFATRQMDKGALERQQRATGAVQKDITTATSTPEGKVNVAESAAIKERIPGFEPGVAKETGDPALLNLQKDLEAKATGPELRAAQGRASQNEDAIRQYYDKSAPPAGTNPEDAAVRAGQERVSALNNRIEGQANDVRGQIAERSNIPGADRVAAGEQLRTERNRLEQQSEAEVNRLRGEIAAPNTVVEVQPAVPATATTPEVPAVTMTVNQILNRRAALNQEARDYRSATNRSVEDIRRMRQINNERQHLDGLIEEINLPGMQQYRDYYRDEHVPRFREGAAKDVGRYDQNAIGKNYVAGEDVPREFFQPNNISEARQFNQTYGENPQARQTMTDYALDSLRTDQSVMDPATHTLRQGGIERWLTKHQRILDEMPWIRDAVQARNPDELYGRLGQLEQRQRTVSDSKLAKTVGKEPGKAVDEALGDWRVARTMKNSVRGDTNADAALTRAVWERLPDPMNAAAMEQFIVKNKRSLDVLLTPEHLQSLDTVINAAKIEGRVPAPKGAAEQPASIADKVGKFAGISIPSFLSRFRAQAQGRTGGVYTAADIGLQMFSKFSTREVEAAWKEALYNPKVAADLASVVSGKATKPIINRMHNYLLTVGARDTTDLGKKPK